MERVKEIWETIIGRLDWYDKKASMAVEAVFVVNAVLAIFFLSTKLALPWWGAGILGLMVWLTNSIITKIALDSENSIMDAATAAITALIYLYLPFVDSFFRMEYSHKSLFWLWFIPAAFVTGCVCVWIWRAISKGR